MQSASPFFGGSSEKLERVPFVVFGLKYETGKYETGTEIRNGDN